MSPAPPMALARIFASASIMAALGLFLVSCSDDGAQTDDETQTANPVQEEGEPLAVVWILLDATRSDHLSSYGYSRKTSPNIDALAERGVLFERNYSQATSTTMSVPSYMTGRYEPVMLQDAHHLDIWFMRTAPEEEVLVSTMFSENGFETAMFSASPWFSEHSTLGQSFDTFARLDYGKGAKEPTLEGRSPELFGWLEEQAGKPFFLYVHSLDTHGPHYEQTTHDTWLDPTFPKQRDQELRAWITPPTTGAERTHVQNLYDGAISYGDSTVGEIIAKLDQLGILGSTVIVIGSDHGELLGENGIVIGHPAEMSHEELLRVPLVMAGPGIPNGQRVVTKTESADIVPTLTDIFSLTTNARMDGSSLIPNLHSPEPADPNDYAFAHTKAALVSEEPNRVLVFDDVKIDISPYDEEGMKYLNVTGRKPTEAWAMPDSVLTRRGIQPSPERLSFAKGEVERVFEPLWKARNTLPKDIPDVFYYSHRKNVVKDAIAFEDDPSDNKWEHRKQGFMGNPMHKDDLMVSRTWLEDAPGLVFGAKVPNETYTVSVYCLTLEPEDGIARGSSFRFLAEGEKSWRLFAIDAPMGDEPNSAWIDVGTYTVTDKLFSYWIDGGNEEDNSVAGALRFVKEGAVLDDSMSEEQMLEEQERLETLGYIQ